MTAHFPQAGPIAEVEVGMRVLDSDGEPIGEVVAMTMGEVVAMTMGDPEAVTTRGQRPPGGGVVGVFRDMVTGSEPDVPPQRADQLLRTGYVKIDAKGLFARDLYAGAEQIHRVDADGVRLAVPRATLMLEN